MVNFAGFDGEDPEVVAGLIEVRIELESFCEGLASFCSSLQVVKRQAQVEPGRGIIRVDTETGFQIA